MTVLHWWIECASGTPYPDEVRLRITNILLSLGADVNARDRDGSTPLHLAANAQDCVIAQALVDGGADLRALDGNGATALSAIIRNLLMIRLHPNPAPAQVAAEAEATPATTAAPPPPEPDPVTTDAGPLATPDSGPFEIHVDAHPEVTYAFAHNRVPVVRRLTIRLVSGPPRGLLDVAVRLVWSREKKMPAKAVSFKIECPPPGAEPVVIEDVGLRLDDTVMVDLEEAVPASVEVTVSAKDGTRRVAAHDVRLLARNQWFFSSDYRELLAAFVQPNHPFVRDITADAARRLKASTGSASLEGYQSGPERAHAIGAAVFEALQARGLRYVNPPASFEVNQKVRPLDEVLETGAGTCIDLACAYASCLQAAGLHPLIWIVAGHAFGGFHSTPEYLDANAEHDPNVMINMRDAGLVVPVETVSLTNGDTFDAAVTATRRRYVPSDLLMMLDVERAHRTGTLPLPARVVRGDVIEVVIDPGPDRAVIYERRERTTGKRVQTTVPPRVERWKSRLLDLSKRNPLVKFSTRRAGIDLLVPTGMLAGIEDDVSGGRRLVIHAGDRLDGADTAAGLRSASDIHHEELAGRYRGLGMLYATAGTDEGRRRLRALTSRARLLESETGANSMFLVLGTLVWRDGDGDELVSPLFLVPVRVHSDRGHALGRIELDPNGFTTPNYCLVEKLKATHRLDVPAFESPPEDDSGIAVDVALEALRRAIHERGLPFRVDETAHLALLQFSKFRLWKDMADHWEAFAQNAVVRHLIERPGQRFIDPAVNGQPAERPVELGTACPLPADGAQLKAIERAAQGHSFVIEGPPGTGKSQTITNLLANALAQGRRVLFVAEKQAALSVVKRRLVQVGLDPYCLDLHDKGSTHDVIRRQLRDALEHRSHADVREFERNDQQLEHLHRRLSAYHRALYAENRVGESYATAHEHLHALGAGPTAVVPIAFLEADAGEHDRVRRAALDLETSARAAQAGPDHPWRLVSRLRFDQLDRPALSRAIGEVEAALMGVTGLSPELQAALSLAHSAEDVTALAGQVALQQQGDLPPEAELDAAASVGWLAAVEKALASFAQVTDEATQALDGHGHTALELDDERFGEAATAVEDAARSFFIGRRGRVAKALGALIDPERARRIPVADAVTLLGTMRQHRARLAKAKGSLASISAFLTPKKGMLLHSDTRSRTAEHADVIARLAGYWAGNTDLAVALRNLATDTRPGWTPAAVGALDRLSRAVRDLWALLDVDQHDVDAWRRDTALAERLERVTPRWRQDGLENRFLQLQRWCALMDGLGVLREAGLDEFAEAILLGDVLPEDIEVSLRRGVLTTSLRERAEHGQLDTFDRNLHDAVVARFVEAIDLRRNHLLEVIPARLADARTIDTDVGFGAVAELRNELQRQRGARSIRRLIARFGGVIQQLTPCFLMSPDSVAKFLPPGSVEFDLVVFDEASQIEVAEAIGSMGRAKSVVVVGDSKQMPPSRFGEALTDEDWDDDEAYAADDAESLLVEAVETGLDQEWLAWHYRSRDESLISFSNAHYYEGRLSSFPHPANQQLPALHWRNVHGQFEHGRRRVNLVEAQAVVDEVVRRLAESPTKSMGVVTLNIQQRNEIIDRLEALGDPVISEQLGSDQLESLFVRNLENVQGDERDVIILSTGYSKTKDGGPMPLRFGPLNRAGGERRLNVAITRAREEVVVISSFEPEEIDERRANALGLLHLREYLRLARDGAQPVEDAGLSVGRDSAHRDAIAAALRSRGLRVATDVGLSPFRVDLAVSRDGEPGWHVAVLLDGWRWRERTTVVDRDALPSTVLERVMGWPRVVRLWLPAWRDEAATILDELETLVDAAIEETRRRPDPPTPNAVRPIGGVLPPDEEHRSPNPGDTLAVVGSRPDPATQPTITTNYDATATVALAGLPAQPAADSVADGELPVDQLLRLGATPFTAYPTYPEFGTRADTESEYLVSPRLRRAIDEAIDCEAPVEAMRLARLVDRRLGGKKLRSDRAERILRHLPKGAKIVRTGLGRFVWAQDQEPAAYTDFRVHTDADDARKLEEVAPEELTNLLHAIIRASGHIQVDELYRIALAALGIARLTTGFRQRLDAIVDRARGAGRFAVDGEGCLVLGPQHGEFPVAPPKPRAVPTPSPQPPTSTQAEPQAKPASPGPAGPPASTMTPPQAVVQSRPPDTRGRERAPGSAHAANAADAAQSVVSRQQELEALIRESSATPGSDRWYELHLLFAIVNHTTDVERTHDVDPLSRLRTEAHERYPAIMRHVRVHADLLGDGGAQRHVPRLVLALNRMATRLESGGAALGELSATYERLANPPSPAAVERAPAVPPTSGDREPPEREPAPQTQDPATNEHRPGVARAAGDRTAVIVAEEISMARVARMLENLGLTLEPLGGGTAYQVAEADPPLLVTVNRDPRRAVGGVPATTIRFDTGVPFNASLQEAKRLEIAAHLNRERGFATFFVEGERLHAVYDLPSGGGVIEGDVVKAFAYFVSVTESAFQWAQEHS